LTLASKNPRLLVTAGNTLAPIDAVRGITNVFTGRTGARIAAEATMSGYEVELLTSHPDVVDDTVVDYSRLTVTTFKTFGNLAALMEERFGKERWDVVIHAAAVSDYRCAGVFAAPNLASPALDATQKIPSRHEELWIRLLPTPKLVDNIRQPWGFDGVLVKFKLEVGVSDDELVRRAREGWKRSAADLVVANCYEWMNEKAFLIDQSTVESVERARLPARLLARIEELRTRSPSARG
jgi:phosphopantothenate---cysteine ligase (CTP)